MNERSAAWFVCVTLAACGGTPRTVEPRPAVVPVVVTDASVPDPDLDPAPDPRPRLLAIDWQHVSLATDADALAVWRQIAPTGADWEQKLDEVPDDLARPLAIALLRAGNFACVPQRNGPVACGAPAPDVPEPAPTAGLDDPCLRRLLALWSFGALDTDDAPIVLDAIRMIATIPPPESQLVRTAIRLVPEHDHDTRLALYALATRAGHGELAGGMVGTLDEPHLIEAVTKHHIAAALDVLSEEQHPAVFLAAIADDDLAADTRKLAIQRMALDPPTLAPPVRKALIAATREPECSVAAAAAAALARHGDARFRPERTRATSAAALLRALCVATSFAERGDEHDADVLAPHLPPKGLELVRVTIDLLSDVDDDGDGDPHTRRTEQLVPPAEVTIPERSDLVRAFTACKATTCTGADHEFRFGIKTSGGRARLARLEVHDLPPCVAPR